MDLLTQIQVGVATLPHDLQESLADLTRTTLSVQEAHALAQLAQTGFVGFQSITNPLTPVGLNDELIPFLDQATDAIQFAQELYSKVRTIDVYIQKIPDTGVGKDSMDSFDAELEMAIEEYNKSVEDLYEAELRSKEIRSKIKTIMDYGVDLLVKPLNVVEDNTANPTPPSAAELFTPF